MNNSEFRPGPFAGLIIIAAVFMLAGAGAAQAACAEPIIAVFDKAVAERKLDAAVDGLKHISLNPGCLTRVAEFRAKLADFLIDYAGTTGIATAERDKALTAAEATLLTGPHWRGKMKLGDYYFAHGDKPKAYEWYKQSIATLSTHPAAERPTDKELKDLMAKSSSALSLANNDLGGTARVHFTPSRAPDGSLGGIYSRDLVRGAGVVNVPLPINFYKDQATFTPSGEEEMKQLIEAAKEVPTMTLVGHADPTGPSRNRREYNMELSRRRVEAVRDRLVNEHAKTRDQITIRWMGDTQEADVSVLPGGDQMSLEDRYQLDRRVEWLRDAVQ
jgi:outer membrane protein OmpA-like peptidoglycan-associated protein